MAKQLEAVQQAQMYIMQKRPSKQKRSRTKGGRRNNTDVTGGTIGATSSEYSQTGYFDGAVLCEGMNADLEEFAQIDEEASPIRQDANRMN